MTLFSFVQNQSSRVYMAIVGLLYAFYIMAFLGIYYVNPEYTKTLSLIVRLLEILSEDTRRPIKICRTLRAFGIYPLSSTIMSTSGSGWMLILCTVMAPLRKLSF